LKNRSALKIYAEPRFAEQPQAAVFDDKSARSGIARKIE
jgi:hypothetical protein